MNNRPMNIPPALAKEIQEALASGKPLPPGVVAVRDGQAPPKGAVPMGISANVPAGMSPGGAPTKLQHNPIPDGPEGLKILRSFSSCPIPQESAKLNQLLQAVLQNDLLDEEKTDAALSKGLIAGLKANKYCASNKKTRTVCMFDQDDELLSLHSQIKEEENTLDRLNKETEECVRRANDLLRQRWEKAVKTYGLNPEKYLYYIDEEKGLIEQVDLDCDQCRGASRIVDARKDVTSLLMSTVPKEDEKKEEEPTDTDPPSET